MPDRARSLPRSRGRRGGPGDHYRQRLARRRRILHRFQLTIDIPRRAVGPDLLSLFFGTGGRAGKFHTVHLRARAHQAEPLETAIERNPAVEEGEHCWLDRATEVATRFS